MSAEKKVTKEEIEVAQESEKAKQQEDEIQKRGCNWEVLFESKQITAEEKGRLTDYSRSKLSERGDHLSDDGRQYAELFVKVLTLVHEKNTTQYVLSLIDEALQVESTFPSHFYGIENLHSEFIRILNGADPYCSEKASRILGVLLSSEPRERPDEVGRFLRWLTDRLNDSKGRTLLQALGSIKDVLKNYNTHAIFCRLGILERLVALAGREINNTQIIYLVAFCTWLLTFTPVSYPTLHTSGILHELVLMIRLSAREKVIRVALAAFRNLLDKSAEEAHSFNEDMIGLGLHKLVATLLPKVWKDADITEDLKVLNRALEVTLEKLSSFEVYNAEISSGALQWSPVHSELFWRENINKFEAKNFAHIKRLVELLESKDETTLEVGCYDLGEFARFYPDGKRVVESFNGKGRLMSLLSHPQPGVRKQALLATQKLMVQNWESLSKSSGGKKGAGAAKS